ncbi:Ubiquitin carboxyl-terminal hydrolase 8 [Amphibalanus amphitrite]|uniref:ubiquitinyl hydrolase 1 n=1 Tax=Amphibalanus amphitrite TaxID=1232801 RepID=A0A6A4X412_AMPAM|nr:Ubiquitin carboxyl-terminal hydrolase 8 [Amphibalanus amphitrite]
MDGMCYTLTDRPVAGHDIVSACSEMGGATPVYGTSEADSEYVVKVLKNYNRPLAWAILQAKTRPSTADWTHWFKCLVPLADGILIIIVIVPLRHLSIPLYGINSRIRVSGERDRHPALGTHRVSDQSRLCSAPACGFESATFETFSLLSLPLALPSAGRASLYHCLDQYVRGDLINDWSCPKCRRRHDVYKKLDLWRLPPVVILHLKRFSFAGSTARKAHAQVSFPLRDLDLSQLAIGPHPDSHSLVYDLYGVVEHHGSQHSGHYTAYCFNQPAASWLFIDDTVVKESSAASVRDATAYLLCYSAREVA